MEYWFLVASESHPPIGWWYSGHQSEPWAIPFEEYWQLQHSASIINSLIKDKDFDAASNVIQKFLGYDLPVVTQIMGDETLYPDNPIKTLKNAKQKLLHEIIDEFDIAAQAFNEANVKRYLAMFAKLGEEIVGLDKFSAFLCGTLARFSQDYLKTADTVLSKSNGLATIFGEIFGKVFEMVANVIERQRALVTTTFGPGKVLRLIQRLQREADIQTCIMFDVFAEKRQCTRKVTVLTIFIHNSTFS